MEKIAIIIAALTLISTVFNLRISQRKARIIIIKFFRLPLNISFKGTVIKTTPIAIIDGISAIYFPFTAILMFTLFSFLIMANEVLYIGTSFLIVGLVFWSFGWALMGFKDCKLKTYILPSFLFALFVIISAKCLIILGI